METETTATDSIDAEDLDPVLAPSDLLDADGRAVYAVAVAASDDGSTIYLINVGDSVAQGEPTLELAVHYPELRPPAFGQRDPGPRAGRRGTEQQEDRP